MHHWPGQRLVGMVAVVGTNVDVVVAGAAVTRIAVAAAGVFVARRTSTP